MQKYNIILNGYYFLDNIAKISYLLTFILYQLPDLFCYATHINS